MGCGAVQVSLVTASGWATGALCAALFALFPFLVHGCIFYTFSQVPPAQPQPRPAANIQWP